MLVKHGGFNSCYALCVCVCVVISISRPSEGPTLEVGKLKVVVVQRQVVLHGREAARTGGEVPDALVLTV